MLVRGHDIEAVAYAVGTPGETADAGALARLGQRSQEGDWETATGDDYRAAALDQF